LHQSIAQNHTPPSNSHTIEFEPVKEWTTPDKVTIEVSNGELVQTTVIYKPPSPKFILKGTLLIGENDGLAWIKLPKKGARLFTLVKWLVIIR